MKRLGSILLIGAVLTGVLVLGAARLGGTLPFDGLHLGSAPEAPRLTIGTVYFEGAGTDTTVVSGDGGSVRLSAGYGMQASSTDQAVPAVRLERKVGGGAWNRTAATVAVPAGSAMTVLTPAFTASAATTRVQYRLATAGSDSRTMTVVYENQRRYTGLAARIYHDLARFCPTTAVHVEEFADREAGNYRTGALLIRIDASVGRTTVLSARDQRALALHECSHERQWVVYGSTTAGRTAMTAAAKRYFTMPGSGVDPVEHAADCGAQAENPGGYLGYGGSCTKRQLHEGERLLHGERY